MPLDFLLGTHISTKLEHGQYFYYLFWFLKAWDRLQGFISSLGLWGFVKGYLIGQGKLWDIGTNGR